MNVNAMRKVFGFVIGLAMVAFALPSSAAPAKIFGVVVPSSAPSTAVSGPVTYYNLSPNGNSVINTVILSPPGGNATTNIVASFPNGGNRVQCPATAPNTSGVAVPVPQNSICVANIPSVMKASCTPTACNWSFNVSATLPVSCGVNTWAAQAFTGNSFNGDAFELRAAGPPASNLNTTINSGCTYSITKTVLPVAAAGSFSCTNDPIPSGLSSTCTANAGTGYAFSSIGGSCSSTSGNTCTFSNVTSNQNVTATFTRKTLSITPPAPTSAAVDAPFDVTFGLSPGNAGGQVSGSSDCGATFSGGLASGNGTSATVTVTIPKAADPNLTPCNLTFSSGDYQSVSLSNFPVYGGQIGCVEPSNYLSSNPTLDPYDEDNTFIGAGIQNGWALRRGPNPDDPDPNGPNTNCRKLNCTVTPNPANHLVNVSCDKAVTPPQNASFEYLVLWDPVPFDQDPFANKLPQLSWGTANPPVYDANCKPAPAGSGQCDFINALICHSDDNTASNAVVLPTIPNLAPFNAVSNPQAQYLYDGIKQALACMAQQGSTPVVGVGVQYWTKIIDRSDLGIKLP